LALCCGSLRAAAVITSPKQPEGNPPVETAAWSSELSATLRAHMHYFADLLSDHGPWLSGGGRPDRGQQQRIALRCIGAEGENIRTALQTAVILGAEAELLQFAKYLRMYHGLRSEVFIQREPYLVLLAAAQKLSSRQLELQARLGSAQVELSLGEYERARATIDGAIALAGELADTSSIAVALGILGTVEFSQGEYSAARERFESMLPLARQAADRRTEAVALGWLGSVYSTQGNQFAAQKMQDAALELLYQIGDRATEASGLANTGVSQQLAGNFPAARDLYEQAVIALRDIGNRRGVALVLNNLNSLNVQEGYSPNEAGLLEALAVTQEIGDRRSESHLLTELGFMHSRLGNLGEATSWLSRSLQLKSELGDGTILHTCAVTASVLAKQNEWHAAAQCVSACACLADATGYALLPEAQQCLAEAQRELDARVEAGALSSAELESWRTESSLMVVEEIVALLLAALERQARNVIFRNRATEH
jgi:tetratricopeptide (TPR) repeat protein